jgi:hypothetical protein
MMININQKITVKDVFGNDLISCLLLGINHPFDGEYIVYQVAFNR